MRNSLICSFFVLAAAGFAFGQTPGVPSTWTFDSNGGETAQPTSGQDAVVLKLGPNKSTYTNDLLDIYCDMGLSSPCFSFKNNAGVGVIGSPLTLTPPSTVTPLTIRPVDSAASHLLDMFCNATDTDPCFSFQTTGSSPGTFVFSGNSVQYGALNQSTASNLNLFGGTPLSAYLHESSASLQAETPTLGETGSSGFTSGTWVDVCFTYSNSLGESLCGPFSEHQIVAAHAAITVTTPSSNRENAATFSVYACVGHGCGNTRTSLHLISGGLTWGSTISAFGSIPATANPPSAGLTAGKFDGYYTMSNTIAGQPCFTTQVPGTSGGVEPCTAGTALLFNPMTTAGDIVYGGTLPASPNLPVAPAARLGIGNAFSLLQVNNGQTAPVWTPNASINDGALTLGASSHAGSITLSGATSGTYVLGVDATSANASFSGGVQVTSNLALTSAGGHINTASSANDMDGTISISAGMSGSHSFSTAYGSAPICVITPTSDPNLFGGFWVTSTASTVVTHTHNNVTATFNYHCVGAPN